MRNYDRKGKEYRIEEVLPFVDEVSNRKVRKDFDGDMIKMTSDRLITFKNSGTKCVDCGMEAKYFVKEKTRDKDEPYHFNLYGIDENGEEVLFTKDHIIPKSKGGANHVSNYQTMCCVCNEKKGNKL